jgi:hypothetical protein
MERGRNKFFDKKVCGKCRGTKEMEKEGNEVDEIQRGRCGIDNV